MSGPYGKARCIALNASRGRNTLLPARNAIRAAAQKLVAKYGGDMLMVVCRVNCNTVPAHVAEAKLRDGFPVTVRLTIPVREGVDLFDAGSYTTHEVELVL